MTWKSTSQDQQEILSAIEALHVPDGFEADCTYGNGDAARLREALVALSLPEPRSEAGLDELKWARGSPIRPDEASSAWLQAEAERRDYLPPPERLHRALYDAQQVMRGQV